MIADLKFDGVSKRYRIRHLTSNGAPHRLRERLQALWRGKQDFWALRDVSFEVARGETLGIIGHNGAGKSTVLKLLSNVTVPTLGEITINGRLSALIEVGSGFHPELTGRENVYLSGSILGMRRREITEKLESIVNFAGVRQFIDTPVKRYSSGMYVRLGFSIAAHLDPDILLLDEVLAVGDAAFQAKCLDRIDKLKRGGTTIVFISHDLGAVERLCDRVLLLQRGEVIASGAPREVIAQYQRITGHFSSTDPNDVPHAILSREAEIYSLAFYDQDGHEVTALGTGDPMRATLLYTVRERIPDAVFELFFVEATGYSIQCHLTTALDGAGIELLPGSGRLEFTCSELGLLPSLYYASATIIHKDQALGTAIDWQHRCARLRVDPGKVLRGAFYMPHQWQIVAEPAGDRSVDTLAEAGVAAAHCPRKPE